MAFQLLKLNDTKFTLIVYLVLIEHNVFQGISANKALQNGCDGHKVFGFM